MEKKSMGSFLTALRKANGLTQKQLAERLNVSDKAVSRWERDEYAPDLSLIPVLAEIYGVTSGEILRGQRTDPEKLYHGVDRAKAEKQRQRILKSAKTKFICRSLITVSLALVGVILAYILNTEFERANAGFLFGSIFFIAAAVSQILFLVTGFASISDEDCQDSPTENCKGFMLLATEWYLGIIGVAVGLCIPLIGKESISLVDCILRGNRWVFAITAISLVICMIINHCLKRKGTVDLKLPLNKLRLRSGTILALVMVLLLGIQARTNDFLIVNKHLYGPHDTHTDARLFQRVIQEPKTEDGLYMYHDDNHEENDVWIFYIEDYSNYEFLLNNGTYKQNVYMLHEDEILKELVPTDAEHPSGKRSFSKEYGYQFSHINRTMPYYEINSAEEVAPIYTFNIKQLAEADHNFTLINLFYMISYAVAVATTLLIYNLKNKNYNKDTASTAVEAVCETKNNICNLFYQ